MAEGCLFIEELPDVILDAYGARLSYESAGVLYLRRYPRGLWRRFLERELMRLHEWEAAERHEAGDRARLVLVIR